MLRNKKKKLLTYKKLLTTLFFFCVIGLTVFSGCKKKNKDTMLAPATPTPTLTPIPTNRPILPSATPTMEPELTVEPNRDKMRQSLLTGLWINQDDAKKRPVAVMLNNIKTANPQSGISDAQILYEALAEGGITRFMGLYDLSIMNAKTEQRIGSVRSARHYFVSIADEYNAIFLHYGQTPYATKKINELGIDTINGMGGAGEKAFYRDKTIKAPHNAFTTKKGILDAIKAYKYKTEYTQDFEGHFKFYDTDTTLESQETAEIIKLGFTNSFIPSFEYNGKDHLYYRNQFGGPHIDANNQQQLSFKNIIVQFVKEWDIDKNGYQTMELEDASGKGYYITNGKKVDITWKKNEATKKMRYYDLDGSELKMNTGKTYIAIFPNNRASKVSIE